MTLLNAVIFVNLYSQYNYQLNISSLSYSHLWPFVLSQLHLTRVCPSNVSHIVSNYRGIKEIKFIELFKFISARSQYNIRIFNEENKLFYFITKKI